MRSLITAVAIAFTLSLAGCLSVPPADPPPADVTGAPVGGGIRQQAGSEEDFIVNVGRRVYFKEGSAALDATAMVTLDKQAAWLVAYPSWKAKIQGFSDDPGTGIDNVALSLSRAEAVLNYLVSKGVDPARLRAKGYGTERLVRDCADIDCKSQNRRVITNLEDDTDEV